MQSSGELSSASKVLIELIGSCEGLVRNEFSGKIELCCCQRHGANTLQPATCHLLSYGCTLQKRHRNLTDGPVT